MARRKKVRLKDIAKQLGISFATVSQALNHPRLVRRQTVKMVMSKCEELGYVKKVSSKKRKGTIGVVAQDIYNLVLGDYYNYVLQGVLAESQKRGLKVEIECLKDENLPLMVSKNSVDGLLLFGKIKKELVLALKQKGVPLILVGHPIPNLELHTVMADGRAGVYELTKHLIELGHRKIAFVYSKPLQDYITADRIEGYRFALIESRFKINEEYLVEADWCSPESSYEATNKLLDLKQPPTAIVYANDPMAYRAYQAIRERKLKIPKDMSIAGFDNMPISDYIEPFKPELTTVAAPRQQIGKTAVDVLQNLIEKPSKIALRYTLPVSLMIKGSTAPPKA
ncbi:MAG: LacI family DNA-binding transcriptional regulator [bacterium]